MISWPASGVRSARDRRADRRRTAKDHAGLQEGTELIGSSVQGAPALVAQDRTLAPHSVYYADGYVHVADQDEGYVLLRLTDEPQ